MPTADRAGDRNPPLIRIANSADVAHLIEIAQRTSGSASWSHNKYQDRLGNESGVVLVAEGHHEIFGFIVAQVISGECEIENVAVLPANQRQGTGRALLTATISAARERGCEAVWLEARESNLAARKFYQAIGFNEAGRRARYYRDPDEDAVILKLTL
jgi:ribosomal-protein-alanine N-acetyltransferase